MRHRSVMSHRTMSHRYNESVLSSSVPESVRPCPSPGEIIKKCDGNEEKNKTEGEKEQ
jgi:hypothetical protein